MSRTTCLNNLHCNNLKLEFATDYPTEPINFDYFDICQEIITSYCLLFLQYFNDPVHFDAELWDRTEAALLFDESGDFPDPVLQVLCRQSRTDDSRRFYGEVGLTDDYRFLWIDFPLLHRRLMEIQTLSTKKVQEPLIAS
jgi:hypothetical protein